MKKSITIVNEVRGTKAVLLLNRETGRLSIRQAREAFEKLSVVGFEPAGKVGEWPLVQRPPECDGGEEEYQIVQVGEPEGGMSNLYFVPRSAVGSLIRRVRNGGESHAHAAVA